MPTIPKRARLTPDQYELILAGVRCGMESGRIARALGIDRTTVYRHIQRLMQRQRSRPDSRAGAGAA